MASSSSVIACINSVVDVLQFYRRPRFRNDYTVMKLRYRLRNLKTFVLLAGKFGNNLHLGSLLITIEDVVTTISRKILPNYLRLEDFNAHCEEVYKRIIASDLLSDFQSLREGVDEWYNATSDNTPQSNSLTADEVEGISESIWENLVDRFPSSLVLREVMERLQEHVNFLKNFCSFAKRRGVDDGQMKDFLTHTEAVAISVAHLCFLLGDDIEDKRMGERNAV